MDKLSGISFVSKERGYTGPKVKASGFRESFSCADGLPFGKLRHTLPEVENAMEWLRNPKEGDRATLCYGSEEIPIIFDGSEWIDLEYWMRLNIG